MLIFRSVSIKVEMPPQIQVPTPISGPSGNLASRSSSDSDPVANLTSNPSDDPEPATSTMIPTTVPIPTTPTPATTAPDVTPTGSEEGPATSEKNEKRGRTTKTTKAPKVKAFRVVLKETTAKYVGQLCPLVVSTLTTPRGICERDWAKENPHGTRASFDAHFGGLSPAKRKVCTIAMDVNPTNTACQGYDAQAAALVVSALSRFDDILTLSPASSKGTETQMTIEPIHADGPDAFYLRVIPTLVPLTVFSFCRSLSALATLPFVSPLLDHFLQSSHQHPQDLDLSQETSLEPYFSHSRSACPPQHHYSSDQLTWRQKSSACFSFSDDG